MNPTVTICALLYGDYPKLAERCLRSIAELNASLHTDVRIEVRIGLNAASPATLSIVEAMFGSVDYPVLAAGSEENICKYPMMRRLFEIDGGIKTPLVMWFDDDSYIKTPTSDWLRAVLSQFSAGVAMCGNVYTVKWYGKQREWVKAQPWYGGQEPAKRNQVKFITGGWWCADIDVLRELDYPWPELKHRGGDTMLGEALLQKGLQFVSFNNGIAVNADDAGRSAAARRRGFDEKPLGETYSSRPPVEVPAREPVAPAPPEPAAPAPPPIRRPPLLRL